MISNQKGNEIKRNRLRTFEKIVFGSNENDQIIMDIRGSRPGRPGMTHAQNESVSVGLKMSEIH